MIDHGLPAAVIRMKARRQEQIRRDAYLEDLREMLNAANPRTNQPTLTARALQYEEYARPGCQV